MNRLDKLKISSIKLIIIKNRKIAESRALPLFRREKRATGENSKQNECEILSPVFFLKVYHTNYFFSQFLKMCSKWGRS